MSWLDEVLKQHEELESPQSFWYWSGLSVISAIVKDHLWLVEGGAWKCYPNVYVILYADSGVGKGPPIALAHKLVANVNNTKVISGRSSIQGILTKLQRNQSRPGGSIEKSCSGFIVASEFSSALVKDPAAMDILTDLFDRKWRAGDWESLLKQEQFTLVNPVISLLAGINESHFDVLLESKDVFGGFIGRCFLIAESQGEKLNPLINDLEISPDIEHLATHLREISKLRGPFKSLQNTPAGECYIEWYNRFYTDVREQEVEDKTGTIRRTRDSVKKVAMLLSLSDSIDLVIKLSHMEEAISVCEKLIGNVRKTTHGKKGMSINAGHKALIIKELMTRDDHRISREMLMKKYYMHFNANELDDVMQAFNQSGMVVSEVVGNKLIYIMPEKEVAEMKRFLEGKHK